MKYRHLGRSGVQVSEICLGGFTLGSKPEEHETIRIIHRALDLGINFIDTADRYGILLSGVPHLSESVIGKAVQGERRDKVVLATKCGGRMGEGGNDAGLSKYHIVRACEASLKALNTSHIDLYQFHFPDGATSLEESLEAMDLLVRQGKILYGGVCNFPAWQVCKSLWICDTNGWTTVLTVQMSYSLIGRDIERDIFPLCRSERIGLIGFSPMAGGFLTGKYRTDRPVPDGARYNDEQVKNLMTCRNKRLLQTLEKIANGRDKTMGQVAIAWALRDAVVCSVIAGATSIGQLEENAEGAGWELSREELETIETAFSAN